MTVFQCVTLILAIAIFSQCSPLAPSQNFGGQGAPSGGNIGDVNSNSAGAIASSVIRHNLAFQLSVDTIVTARFSVLSGPFQRVADSSIKVRLVLTAQDLNTLEASSRVELYGLDRLVEDSPQKDILQKTHAATAAALRPSLRFYTSSRYFADVRSAIPSLSLKVSLATSNEELMLVLSSQNAASTTSLVNTCRTLIQNGFSCDIELR